jgi:glutathione peroxidase
VAAGLELLAYPCNQFLSQEPGTEAEIIEFVRAFGAEYPIHTKVDVNGGKAHPLWETMKKAIPGFMGTKMVKWNFTKFLIGRDGSILKRYSPNDEPNSIEADIVEALKAEAPGKDDL